MMADAARDIAAILSAESGCRALPPPALPSHDLALRWDNALFESPVFRRAHVELFHVPGTFAVLHVCIFPRTTVAAPVFGFDMVAGRDQATGAFLDYSPVVSACTGPTLAAVVDAAARDGFGHHRARPDWGGIFSPAFFAVRPSGVEEAGRAMALGQRALRHYAAALRGGAWPAYPEGEVRLGQAAYAAGQRRNPHTLRMLARFVGQDAAEAFMREVLFPG
jgi:phycocyanobilin:ferredoxin oxidoreductase